MRVPLFAHSSLVLAAGLMAASLANAVTLVLQVQATVLSKNECKMNSSTVTIVHDPIDQSSLSPAVKSQNFTFVCRGSDPVANYSLSAGTGLHASGGSNRLSGGNGEFMPYTISFSPSSGSVPKNVTQTITVTSTIPVTSFQDVPEGTYTDSVVITVDP